MTDTGMKPVAVRLEESILKAIDQKRLELAKSTGAIPTRSDVVRLALEEYLKPPAKAAKKR